MQGLVYGTSVKAPSGAHGKYIGILHHLAERLALDDWSMDASADVKGKMGYLVIGGKREEYFACRRCRRLIPRDYGVQSSPPDDLGR